MNDPITRPWEPAMQSALAAAHRSLRSGDVPVGAVIVGEDGAILATGSNEREASQDPTAHAELVAIRTAAAALGTWRLERCTLVVTLEPCLMCAGAILAARIPRLIFGAWDAKAGASGSVYDIARDRRLPHRAEVIGGVLENESAALLDAFFAERRGAPHAQPAD